MLKYEQLRSIITDRLVELKTLNFNTAINYSKEAELKFILAQMDRLDNNERLSTKEQELEQQVKITNQSLSDAAEAEWEKEKQSFLYQGVPTFDKAAFQKILNEKGINRQVA